MNNNNGIKHHIVLLETLDLTYPLPTVWKGATSHIGPVQMVTKQVQNLCDKTTCGTVTIMAAVIVWAAKRLENFTDVSFMYELAEASFAWQFDWRYFDHTAQPHYQAPDEPIEESASLKIDYFLRYGIKGEDPWHSFYQPIMPLSHMINITNYILVEKKIQSKFKAWLKDLTNRINQIATAPEMDVPNFYKFESKALYWEHCAPRRGKPLPPLVLNIDDDISKYDLEVEAKKFLQSLDYKNNRFLRSPEEMKELGFVGEPYNK
jgi:hypothetical protein